MDLVKCNLCGASYHIKRDATICPNCDYDGGLMDIKQDVEV